MKYYVVELIDNAIGSEDHDVIFNELPTQVIGVIKTETSPSKDNIFDVVIANFNPDAIVDSNIRPSEYDDDYLHVELEIEDGSDTEDIYLNVYETDIFEGF